MYEEHLNVREAMKWKSPEIRSAERRGFLSGFVTTLVVVAVVILFIVTLMAIS